MIQKASACHFSFLVPDGIQAKGGKEKAKIIIGDNSSTDDGEVTPNVIVEKMMRVVETTTNITTIEKEKTDEEMDRVHVSYSIFCI